MNNTNIQGTSLNNSNENYFPQIDLLKALAIISVLILHSSKFEFKAAVFAQFHIWQAVPLFFILMGLNMGIFFSKRNDNYSLIENYSNRFKKIFFPFILIFVITLIYLFFYDNIIYFDILWLIGRLPKEGPGNYFLSILFQFIIISPIIYLLFKKSPKLMLITLFLINISFELIAPYVIIFDKVPYLYNACIFRYFSAIGLGLYFHEELMEYRKIDVFSKKNVFIWYGFPISITYLFFSIFVFQPVPFFREEFGFQNVISFFYPLVIIIIIINLDFTKIQEYIPSFILNYLLKIGKASYHIFLVQMVYFECFKRFIWPNYTLPTNSFWIGIITIFINISITTGLGYLFYYFSNMLFKKKNNHKGKILLSKDNRYHD